MSTWPKVGIGGLLEMPPALGLSPTPAFRGRCQNHTGGQDRLVGSPWESTQPEHEAPVPPFPSALSSGDGTRLLDESLSSSGQALPIAPPLPPPQEPKPTFGGTASVPFSPVVPSNPGAFIIAEAHGKDGHLPRVASARADGYKQLG